MKHYRLHEVAKFLAGLVAGDFLCAWWLWAQGLLPMTFWGVTWTTDTMPVILTFDAALFIILVYYGWHIGRLPAIRERGYLFAVGAIFGAVALEHIARLLFNYHVTIADIVIPTWLSWMGTIVSLYLAYMSFHLAVRVKR